MEIPQSFIDDFYNENTMEDDFVIELDTIAKWLEASKKNLVKTLRRSYTEHIDYIQKKNDNKDNNNYKVYLLTPDCFKHICMMSRSKNSDKIRTYYIQVEKTRFMENMKIAKEIAAQT